LADETKRNKKEKNNNNKKRAELSQSYKKSKIK